MSSFCVSGVRLMAEFSEKELGLAGVLSPKEWADLGLNPKTWFFWANAPGNVRGFVRWMHSGIRGEGCIVYTIANPEAKRRDRSLTILGERLTAPAAANAVKILSGDKPV